MCGCRLVSASVYFSVKFHYYKVVRGVHTFQKEISREPLINLILYIYIYIYIYRGQNNESIRRHTISVNSRWSGLHHGFVYVFPFL